MTPLAWLAEAPAELTCVALPFALFVVPRILVRSRIPAALTASALGAGSGMGLGLFVEDHTVHLLSTLGITSLFLFAGLEVDLSLLRGQARSSTTRGRRRATAGRARAAARFGMERFVERLLAVYAEVGFAPLTVRGSGGPLRPIQVDAAGTGE